MTSRLAVTLERELGLNVMGQLTQDLRYAARTFVKAPVFVVVTVLSLAFGIGANTAIYSLVDQLLLRLLPVKEPQQLVMF